VDDTTINESTILLNVLNSRYRIENTTMQVVSGSQLNQLADFRQAQGNKTRIQELKERANLVCFKDR